MLAEAPDVATPFIVEVHLVSAAIDDDDAAVIQPVPLAYPDEVYGIGCGCIDLTWDHRLDRVDPPFGKIIGRNFDGGSRSFSNDLARHLFDPVAPGDREHDRCGRGRQTRPGDSGQIGPPITKLILQVKHCMEPQRSMSPRLLLHVDRRVLLAGGSCWFDWE